MRTLAEIMNENLSDKGTTFGECHSYTTFYERWFDPLRDAPLRFLEIGVCDPRKHGASLASWYEYFTKADIYGFDIVDATEFDNNRVTTFVGDQSNRDGLGRFVKMHGSDFDVIMDDGSHVDAHQQISLGFLFPHLKPRGQYVIEDMHVSPQTVSFLRALEKGDEAPSSLEPSELEYLVSNLESLELFCGDKLARLVKQA